MNSEYQFTHMAFHCHKNHPPSGYPTMTRLSVAGRIRGFHPLERALTERAHEDRPPNEGWPVDAID